MAEGAWTILDFLTCLFGLAIAYGVLRLFVNAFWPAEVQPDLDELYGDASDTPKMLLDAKRANHKRGM